MITSPSHQNETEKTGVRERAASITKHLSNDCLRSDIDLKHHLMDDLKRQGMGEDVFTVTQMTDNWLVWGVWEDFKINAARISRSNFSCLC